MGFTSRRPILPAPTDSLLGSTDDAGITSDVGTDLSRRSDKTSETIPEDGRPITITTSHKRNTLGKLGKSSQQSQTSLLIEYFEGSKGTDPGQRRPSLRVRVTPSKSHKNKDKGEGHILVTESKSTRRPSHTHLIPVGGNETLEPNEIDSNISSLGSAERLAFASAAPVEIEVLRNNGSDVSGQSVSPELKPIIPESDISSMPAESSLGLDQPATMSQSAPRGSYASSESATLKPPVINAERNLSNERITQKVIEKLSNKPRTSASGRRSSGRRTTVSAVSEAPKIESRTRAPKTVDDDSTPSATNSSLLSASHLSAEPRPTDDRSVRSGASNVSITNNPKLLQTVEDAIRRLILPELNEIRRDQKHSHRVRHDKSSNPSDISSSTVSREEQTRRKSSGSKSKRRVSQESGSSRHHRRHKTVDYDSVSEQSYEQSESSSLRKEKRSHRHSKSNRARDVAAGALGGAALTAAALKSHESDSSLDYPEQRSRRRSSKSRSSHSTSMVERDDSFSKHRVPPMPFISEIGTDLTRSSLQSSNDGGAMTPTQHEVREVVRGSSLELPLSGSHTPTRNSFDLKRGLGTHHANFSEHDLSAHDLTKNASPRPAGGDEAAEEDIDFATHGFAALTDPERARQYERNLHQQHPIRRGLSPIQSVASYTTTEPNRNSIMQQRSSDSIGSSKKLHQMDDQVSISTLSSAPTTDLARSRRPHGFSLENRSEIMGQHGDSVNNTPHQGSPEAVFDEQHLENESYRDAPYTDQVTAGQQVAKERGAIAEFVEAPLGVESAVASLCEPSVVDIPNTSRMSQGDSSGASDVRSSRTSQRDYESRYSGSPLKQQLSLDSRQEQNYSNAAAARASPVRSPHVTEHAEDRSARSVRSAQKIVTADVADAQAEHSPESDITTNPSIIRGPIGGLAQGSTDHWPYDPTPPRSQAELKIPLVSRDIGSAGTDLVPEALTINRDHELDPQRDPYVKPQSLATPPGAKDEGYETGANARSPGLYSQGQAAQNDRFTPEMPLDNHGSHEDPFTNPREQYISGLSHGLSPMYDSASGRGRDHIQSKDIVALMDHLTVRDAQRNARDTEILVTLVRSAAEMRNSFEDMKNFITKQDEAILDVTEKQHERTQKMVGGPRPQPVPTARPAKSAVCEEDLPTKRRNVFQRALRGLGAKNTQELQNIEAMLMRLLDEVEGLRVLQVTTGTQEQPRSTSLASADNARAPTDTGYEPEGQAGTSSTGDRSGFFSNNSSRQADYRNYNIRRDSGNRVSTVMEGDEEYDDYGEDLGAGAPGNIHSPSHAAMANASTPHDGNRHARGGSVPLNTPPRMHDQNAGSLSNENTPHLSTGEGSWRKHKSFASSLLPKMVSRWSKTTASSADNYRSSTQRIRPYSESNFGEYEYEQNPQMDERAHSSASYHDEYNGEEGRPPSPLIPSQVSDNPKYQAHRNSVNLQHPQPRQGPTGRFQSRLESEAQNYNDQLSPTSHISSHWDNNSGLHNPTADETQYGRQFSPISDMGFSDRHGTHLDNRSIRSGNSEAPPRPPKILNDEPLVPQRPPKVLMSPPMGQRQPTYVDHVAAARAGSPAYDKSPVAALRSPQSQAQARKPSGPRPLASGGGSKSDMNAVKRSRFRGSPNQIDSDDEVARPY